MPKQRARAARPKAAKARMRAARKGITENSESQRGKNPRSLENLRPFVKDDPRINRGGRPKILSGAYSAWLEKERVLDNGETVTNAELVARGQGVAAIGGNTQAAREIRQATEGDTLNLSDKSDDELLSIILAGSTGSGGDTQTARESSVGDSRADSADAGPPAGGATADSA